MTNASRNIMTGCTAAQRRPMQQNACAAMPRNSATRQVRRKPLTRIQRFARFLVRRKDALLDLMAVALFAITALIAIGKLAHRADELRIRDCGRERACIEYTVGRGETLWSISEDMAGAMPEYKTARSYLYDLKAENGLYGDGIKAGQTLKLPYYKTPDAQADTLAEYGI